MNRGVLVPKTPGKGEAPMLGTEEAADLLGRMEQVRGRPEELSTLLAIVSGKEVAAAEAGAVRQLRERLVHLLSDAQRDVEDLLARTDRRLEPEARAAEGAVPPPVRSASAAGAYLSTAPLRAEPGPADPSPAARRGAAMDRQAEIGELTARILAIQEGLSAL
jgi:hypothetical protein